MIILCYGVTKSGSTLGFELCKALLEVRGFPQRQLPDGVVFPNHSVNFLMQPTPASLEALQASLVPGERIAIKLHGPLPAETRAVLDADTGRRFRTLISYRDPREVCLSLMDAGARIRERDSNPTRGFGLVRTLEDAARFTGVQLQDLRSWARLRQALYLYYNDVAFATDGVIDRLCAALDLDVPDVALRTAVKQQVFEHAHTLRNKAVMDRYRTDLEPAQEAYLQQAIPGLADFIERACRQRDTAWIAA